MAACVVVAWVAAAVALDQYGLRQQPSGSYDAVVVAGAGVRPGGRPSVALYGRTRQACDLWEQGVAPVLALTGGVGDYPPSEAEVARQLAREWGVPAERIVMEERSTSTEENAEQLATVLAAERVLVVSDGYHVFRVRRVFGRHFDSVDAVGVKTTLWVRAWGSLREVLAIAWYAIRGRL